MELIGNLIENACKYGQTKVQISAKIEERPVGKELVIIIEDDGPGIPASLHETILTRGAAPIPPQLAKALGWPLRWIFSAAMVAAWKLPPLPLAARVLFCVYLTKT